MTVWSYSLFSMFCPGRARKVQPIFATETKGVAPGAEKAFLLEELAGCSSHSRG